MVESVIKFEGVGKRYWVKFNPNPSIKSKFIGLFDPRYRERSEEFWALKDISFSVAKGESVGFIGPNGSGKSTLLKIIAQIVRQTSGSASVKGLIAPMIELGVGFHPELTGMENVFLNTSFYGLGRRETRAMVPAIQEFSELGDFIHAPLKNYSSGMVLRLAFSIAVRLSPDILIIDEILAVGDAHFQAKCLDRIRSFKEENRTIVLVSHSLEQVALICDRAFFLDQGRIRCEGPPSAAIAAYNDIIQQGGGFKVAGD